MEQDPRPLHAPYLLGRPAGLYYHHGIEKRSLPKKLFGVYETHVLKPALRSSRGFDDIFYAPNSRYTEVWKADILKVPELELIAYSNEAGVYAVKTQDSRQFFVMAIRSTTRTHWPKSTGGTGTRGWTSRYRSTTSPTTIRRSPLLSAGAAPDSCCTPTGSITTCIRPLPMTWPMCAESGAP